MGIMRKLNNAANAMATSKFRIDTNHRKHFWQHIPWKDAISDLQVTA